LREKQIKHQNDKKLRHNLRTVIDRGMDRTVMGARRSYEGKPEAADHLLRAMEYLVEAKALSNEMMRRWGRDRKQNRQLIKKIQEIQIERHNINLGDIGYAMDSMFAGNLQPLENECKGFPMVELTPEDIKKIEEIIG